MPVSPEAGRPWLGLISGGRERGFCCPQLGPRSGSQGCRGILWEIFSASGSGFGFFAGGDLGERAQGKPWAGPPPREGHLEAGAGTDHFSTSSMVSGSG